MTAPSLHDRLVRTFSKSDPTSKLINPDGPEAAERIRALEEGLRSFSEIAQNVVSGSDRDGDSMLIYVTAGDLRQARSLLSPTTAPAILAEKGDTI